MAIIKGTIGKHKTLKAKFGSGSIMMVVSFNKDKNIGYLHLVETEEREIGSTKDYINVTSDTLPNMPITLAFEGPNAIDSLDVLIEQLQEVKRRFT